MSSYLFRWNFFLRIGTLNHLCLNHLKVEDDSSIRWTRKVQATPLLKEILPCSMFTLARQQQQVGRLDTAAWLSLNHLGHRRVRPSHPDDLLWLRCNDWWHIWPLPWLQSGFLCRDYLLACNQNAKECKCQGEKIKMPWQTKKTHNFSVSQWLDS